MHRSLSLLLGILLLPAGAVAQPRTFARQQWTVADGLPVNSITGILQPRDGYLWLSTFDGLVRFDGARFVVFNTSTSPGLPSNRIVDLIEAGDGTMLLATENRRLVRYARGVFSAEPPAIAVLRLVPDGEGGAWVGTSSGLLHYRQGSLTPVAPAQVTGPIETIARDRHGAIWCGGEHGLHRVNGEVVTTWTSANGLSSNEVTAILELPDGSMLFGTHTGLDRLAGNSFTRVASAAGVLRAHVFSLYRSGDDRMLVGTDAGLFELSGGRVIERQVGKGPSYLRTVRRLADGSIWSAFGGAIYRDGQLVHDAGARVTTLFEDPEGSIWFGTDGAGLHRLRPSMLSVVGAREGLADENVYPVFEDSRGAIWTGMSNVGVARLENGVVTNFGRANGWPLLARSFAEDRDGRLHIGMLGGGVCVVEGRSCVKIGNAEFQQSSVQAMAFDRAGTLWIGTDRGLYRRIADGTWSVLTSADGVPPGNIRVVTPIDSGGAWIGTNGGGVALVEGKRVTALSVEQGLSSNLVRAIHVDRGSHVWVGTEDRGLNRLTRSAGGWTIAVIRRADGLYDDVIHQILEDDQERFWMTTNRGIFSVLRRSLDAFADGDRGPLFAIAFTERDGMRNREANGGVQPAGVRAKDGRLWFPTQGGLVVLDPRRRLSNDRPPAVVIERVRHSGRTDSGAEPLVSLPRGIREFEIDYTALSFVAPGNIRFEYQLEDLDERPTDAGNRRTAYFTNVPPGRHRFRVAAANSDGVWNREGAAVVIDVPPLFYETAWFRVAAVFALVLMVAGALRVRDRRLTARQKALEMVVAVRTRDLAEARARAETALETIAEQADQLRELDRTKSAFFANVSHEFRTPLTMTIGPLQDLRAGVHGDLTPVAAQQVDYAIDHSRRLLRMVNQILDLSRLESGHMKLDARPGDLGALLRAVALAFAAHAERRRITFIRDIPAMRVVASFDAEQLEKVIANVLGNAMKYTQDGGTVRMSMAVAEQAIITVSDNGPGIAPEDLPHIFDRFYRAAGAAGAALPGTGIGLSLARELVELHGGAIAAESLMGKGTTFTIMLPIDTSAGAEDHVATARDEPAADGTQPPSEPSGDVDPDQERPLILIADDHADIRSWVRGRLEPAYRVVEAADGRRALEMSRELLPDLIVSDVMMPLMDGFALCRALKGDPDIDFIPIILLTARAAEDSRVEGLTKGADDYLTKPFSMPELLARIGNLIESRKRLRARFAAAPANPFAPSPADFQSTDAAFVALVKAEIEERMGDPALDVETLAQAVGVSRSNLYRRLRDLTGKSPADVIRSMRLVRAAHMLSAGAGNVGEVAYAVGFESLSHFGRVFRAEYGASPSAWARQHAEKA